MRQAICDVEMGCGENDAEGGDLIWTFGREAGGDFHPGSTTVFATIQGKPLPMRTPAARIGR